DSCRLMHLRADGSRDHRVFSELPALLRPGDTLVLNDSRVLPARVYARRPTGGEVEILFLRPLDGEVAPSGAGEESWEALARPSHRLRPGHELTLSDGERLTLRDSLGEGRWVIAGPSGRSLVATMEAQGMLPLPPYIRTYPDDPAGYQTVYARVSGSAAAPTAGLHFTRELLDRLREVGVRSTFVTLHVGLDTFRPIRTGIVEDHPIHRETYSVPLEALRGIREARASGRRLIAVGTTVTRVLETLAGTGVLEDPTPIEPACGSTDIFITPGHRFRVVDALLTNFHLPRSSVLALTMAFAGADRLREAYQEAMTIRYRFFSFGDAMLIEPAGARRGETPEWEDSREACGDAGPRGGIDEES
ncbi:MAG: tRNA preQ1(34) S-adenosylmethionine ribosyltransferase-isomerase QueA, partial [Actinomycetia bacterium]|nr:tRNA preQ1(34) S-adenosylmethionine ribosyltransferase-isomerase QueA [Actinomycetes bacterium]